MAGVTKAITNWPPFECYWFESVECQDGLQVNSINIHSITIQYPLSTNLIPNAKNSFCPKFDKRHYVHCMHFDKKQIGTSREGRYQG